MRLLPSKRYDWDEQARAEQQLMPVKFAQAVDPAKYGVSLNDESLAFLAAVQEGFVPKTLAGWETLVAWRGSGQKGRVQAGQFEFDAWQQKRYGVPYASAASQAAANATAFGVSATEWAETIDRIYGTVAGDVVITDWLGRKYYPAASANGASSISGGYTDYRELADGTKQLTLKNGIILRWGAPPAQRVFRPFLQVIYKDAEFTPGVGMRVPPLTLAWREINREMGSPGHPYNFFHEVGQWTPWKGAPVGSTGDGDVQAWNINNVPNADMELARWDMDGLKAAIAAPGSTPPRLNWSVIKHSGNMGPQATPAAAPPSLVVAQPTPYIPPGTPVTTAVDGSLVPLTVNPHNDPVMVDDDGAQVTPVNPREGFAALGGGLGLVALGLGAWFLWSRRH